MFFEKKAVIGALIGLVGACGSNGTTKESDRALLFGLKSLSGTEADQHRAIEEIHKIRDSIAPGCMICQVPCGNTADYDMAKLDSEPEEFRHLKSSMIELAGHAVISVEAPNATFYAALYQLIQGMTENEDLSALQEILEDARPILEQ